MNPNGHSRLGEYARATLALRSAVVRQATGDARSKSFVAEAEVRAYLDGTSDGTALAPLRLRAIEARQALEASFDQARRDGSPSPLDRLASSLDLATDERAAIALIAATELNPILGEVAHSCADDPIVPGLTPLAVAETVALGDPPAARRLLSAFGLGGAFTRFRLVRGAPVHEASAAVDPREPVALDPTVRSFLAGDPIPRVDPIPEDTDEDGTLDPDSVERVRAGLALAALRSPRAFRVAIVGPDPSALRELLAREVNAAARPVLRFAASDALASDGLARLEEAMRNALLAGAVLYIAGAEALLTGDEARPSTALRVLAAHRGPIAFASTVRLPRAWLWFDGLVEIRVRPASALTHARQAGMLLGGTSKSHKLASEVAPRFALNRDVVQAAVAEAQARAGGDEVTPAMLSAAMRSQLRSRLGDFADEIGTNLGWDDLHLPDDSKTRLWELVSGWKNRERVLEEWGFGTRIAHSRGMSALLWGPPGTGKTMAAGIVARELGLEVFRVDLSRIVDKYIGETEKHLARVFDEAERGQVLLLFDEADSLFGKRTSVQSSIDRYANLETNYLLQRMESYEGVVVLTTNNEQFIDDAFKRRLRYRIHFPMPSPPERERIWRNLLPAAARVEEGIDFERLAEGYEMSGGHIRNAVLRAAYLAADSGAGISFESLRKAADIEYREMGNLVREETEQTRREL